MKNIVDFLKNQWKSIVIVVLVILLVVSSVKLNEAEVKNKELQQELSESEKTHDKLMAYADQMSYNDDFMTMFADFLVYEDRTKVPMGTELSYSSNTGEAKISVLYAKKMEEGGVYATEVDTNEHDLYVVGVNIINTGDKSIRIRPKEFFLKEANGNYLKYEYMWYKEMLFEDMGFSSDTVLVEGYSEKTIVIEFIDKKSNKEKSLSVRYGETTWVNK